MAYTMNIPAFSNVNTHEGIKDFSRTHTDCVRIFDNTDEFLNEAERAHSSSYSVSDIRRGDLSVVAEAERLIEKFQHLSFNTSNFRIGAVIAGGVPNVPAMLAGNPLNMRSRQRAVSAMAPLNIVIETTASSGYGGSRGVALLALASMLSAVRPVKLFVTAMGLIQNSENQKSQSLAMPLDTSPLDLARAGAMIGHPDWTANAGYYILRDMAKSSAPLGWAYGSSAIERGRYHEYWSRALGIDGQELLAVPAAYLTDSSDPETWLKEALAKYGGMEAE